MNSKTVAYTVDQQCYPQTRKIQSVSEIQLIFVIQLQQKQIQSYLKE